MLDMELKDQISEVELSEFITISIGGQKFCIETGYIQEIRQWSTVTYLPGSEQHTYGALNLRGTVLPIIDLAFVLGYPAQDPGERHAIIIVKNEGKMCGYLVEDASRLIKIPKNEVKPTPEISKDNAASVSGAVCVDEDLVQILAVQKLIPFNAEEQVL